MNPGNFDIRIPLVEHLGIRLLELRDGTAVMAFDPRPEHGNSWGGVHGGILLTLLDIGMGTAARGLEPGCAGATTVELKANFLAVAKGALTTRCRAQRTGRSLIFAEGEVHDGAGTLLAKGSGTFKLVYANGGREQG
jgi:uncharacterized protein (TIGR00369 family)